MAVSVTVGLDNLGGEKTYFPSVCGTGEWA